MSTSPTIANILGSWLDDPTMAEIITSARRLDAEAPEHASIPDSLDPRLIRALNNRGIHQLYSHQRAAIDAAAQGENTVLVTPTASGKSLCFNLPVLNDLMAHPDGRALFIYPTKALTQDQYSSIHQLIEEAEAAIRTFTFDGDTPADARQAVREVGQVVLTNPDMLHAGILPHHTKWLKLLRNLRWVIVDELHAYKGVFGSHLGNVIRRLKRLCAFHGSNPTFIGASATIANPLELAHRLLEVPVTLIDRSGAPRAARHMVFANPPIVNRQLGIRRSYLHLTRRVVTDLLAKGLPTIVFITSRINVEILVKYLREDLAKRNLDPALVQGYRGGYLPTRRRRIEAGLRDGNIQCVVSTNALELGIDVGELTACVIAGYPGSIASVWQQSGRAGRRSGESLTVLVGRSTALDQYLVQHPEYFFGRNPEEARVDANNPYILMDHLKCAAFELPFEVGSSFGDMSPEDTEAALTHLEQHGVVHRAADRYHWMDRSYPANHVNLRRVEAENFTVIDVEPGQDRKALVIAEVDFASAHTTLYEHAIYNLDGVQYQVEELDYDERKAFVRRVDSDYFTYAHSKSKVQVLSDEATNEFSHVGEVLVTEKVVGFKKIKFHTHENVGYGEVHLPEVQMHTEAMWIPVPPSVVNGFAGGRDRLVDALRGIGHALHTVASLRMMCTRRDIGLTVDKPEDSGPRLYLYDNIPGGVGFAMRLHNLTAPLLAGARELIDGCACSNGCPSCIGASREVDSDGRRLACQLIDDLLGKTKPPLRLVPSPSV